MRAIESTIGLYLASIGSSFGQVGFQNVRVEGTSVHIDQYWDGSDYTGFVLSTPAPNLIDFGGTFLDEGVDVYLIDAGQELSSFSIDTGSLTKLEPFGAPYFVPSEFYLGFVTPSADYSPFPGAFGWAQFGFGFGELELLDHAVEYSGNGIIVGTAEVVFVEPTRPDVVINELDSDPRGEGTGEFVELFNNEGEEKALDGLVLVMYGGEFELAYQVLDLAGSVIPADGFFVVGVDGGANVDLVLAGTGESLIDDGPAAVALYAGSAESFAGSFTAAEAPGILIDAVVYGSEDPEATGLLLALMPGGIQLDEGVRAGTGVNFSLARLPDGGEPLAPELFATSDQRPTPGGPNEDGIDLGYDAYQLWVIEKGLIAGLNDGADDDAEHGGFGDGIPNLLEFVLGGDPLGWDRETLPRASVEGDDFVFIFERSDDSEDLVELRFELLRGAGSLDFGEGESVIIGPASSSDGEFAVTIDENLDDTDRVEVRVSKAGNEAIFGRLRAGLR